MEIRKYLALVCLISSATAWGQTANFNANDVKNVFQKMSAVNAAKLALQNQVGNCKAIKPAGGSSLYVLTWYESGVKKTQRFGLAQAQYMEAVSAQQNYSTSSIERSHVEKFISELKNAFFMPSAYAALPANYATAYSIPVYAVSVSADAQTQLGTKVKSLVAGSKCTGIQFTAFNQDVSKMRNDLKFYKIDGNIKCTAIGFEKKIRAPGSCTYLEVESPLPDKACGMLYRTYSTVKSRVTEDSSVPAAPPVLHQVTAQVLQNFAIDSALQANPELHAVVNAAEVTAAENYLSHDVLNLIETQTISAATFDALPVSAKNQLVHLVTTVTELQGQSAYPAFSSNITGIVSAVKSKAEAYATANSVTANIYAIPAKAIVANHLDTQLQVITNITNTPYSYHLNCLSDMMAVSVQTSSAASNATFAQ